MSPSSQTTGANAEGWADASTEPLFASGAVGGDALLHGRGCQMQADPCFRPGCRTWEWTSGNKEGEEGTSWPPCPDLVITLILMGRNSELLF